VAVFAAALGALFLNCRIPDIGPAEMNLRERGGCTNVSQEISDICPWVVEVPDSEGKTCDTGSAAGEGVSATSNNNKPIRRNFRWVQFCLERPRWYHTGGSRIEGMVVFRENNYPVILPSTGHRSYMPENIILFCCDILLNIYYPDVTDQDIHNWRWPVILIPTSHLQYNEPFLVDVQRASWFNVDSQPGTLFGDQGFAAERNLILGGLSENLRALSRGSSYPLGGSGTISVWKRRLPEVK
jgi:hypothetical protein